MTNKERSEESATLQEDEKLRRVTDAISRPKTSNGVNSHTKRAVSALILAIAAGAIGYLSGGSGASAASVSGAAATITAPPANSIRVLYSLDQKKNDQELVTLIDGAQSHIYFAIYEFTLKDVADALVRAKGRGVDVRGLVDSGESSNSYDKPLISELIAAGIPVETEKHADGNGIMHIKALVTDSAYAMGSFNWTGSATAENDEILEIGTDPAMVKTYEELLLRLLAKYAGNTAAAQSAAAVVSSGTYSITEAKNHVGEYASVTGTLLDAYTSASGIVFLDFCKSYKTCPFSGVIFAGDAGAFGDLSRWSGKSVTLTGKITSYQGTAEIKLTKPNQLQ